MSIQKLIKMFDIDVGDDLPASLENDHDLKEMLPRPGASKPFLMPSHEFLVVPSGC